MDRFIPDETLAAHEAAIRAATADLAGPYPDLDDPTCGLALRHALLFADADRVVAAGLGPIEPVDLFYNRYLWFVRFARLHAPDAGIDQQLHQLLEAAPDDVDWNVVAWIEATR